MRVTSYYPVLCVRDVAASSAFYQRHFGFVPAFENDWYAHLTAPDSAGVNLGLVAYDHASVPGPHRVPAQGVLVNFEVADVDAEYARLKDSVPVVTPLRDEAFGQRHFILSDPDGALIDVITPIPPSAEFAAQYKVPATP
ncbi:MAG: VOC family protein [Alphaproteobacteria bacterium]